MTKTDLTNLKRLLRAGVDNNVVIEVRRLDEDCEDYSTETISVGRRFLLDVLARPPIKRYKSTDKCYRCNGTREFPGIVASSQEYISEMCPEAIHQRKRK